MESERPTRGRAPLCERLAPRRRTRFGDSRRSRGPPPRIRVRAARSWHFWPRPWLRARRIRTSVASAVLYHGTWSDHPRKASFSAFSLQPEARLVESEGAVEDELCVLDFAVGAAEYGFLEHIEGFDGDLGSSEPFDGASTKPTAKLKSCLLYTSDAADERSSVD